VEWLNMEPRPRIRAWGFALSGSDADADGGWDVGSDDAGATGQL
jgi:hypothetical protein